MSSSSISPQWELNRTAEDFQTLVKGFIIASTTDDVPFNALYVAEAFGATVAVSDDTKINVERAAKLSGTAVVRFLKATIGYSKGDAPDFLSRSDGGVRLLGIASALLCTSSRLFAARALSLMIQASAPPSVDHRILPTILQLESMFTALDSKLSRSGFAELVSRWQVVLGNLPNANRLFTNRSKFDDIHPSAEMLKALVAAFSHIKRIGETEEGNNAECSIEIWAHQSIPWITAFTEWSLGSIPTIRLEDGTLLVEQPDAVKVCLWVGLTAANAEEVKIVHQIEEPTLLWRGSAGNRLENHSWSGMMPVRDYGRKQISSIDPFDSQSSSIEIPLQQALSASLPKVVSRLWPTGVGPLVDGDPPYHPALSNSHLSQCRTQKFPDNNQLQETFYQYTGVRTSLITLEEGNCIFGLLKVVGYEDSLARGCACAECLERTRGTARVTIRDEKEKADVFALLSSQCPVKDFRHKVAMITAEILAISLFDCTEPVRVFWPGRAAAKKRVCGGFLAAIESIILPRNDDNAIGFCRAHDIFSLALSLIGHNASADIEAGTWIASVGRGQVIYPRIFDVGVLDKSGVLSLGGGLGRLTFQNDEYGKVVSEKGPPTLLPSRNYDRDIQEVSQPLHLFQGEKLEWQVTRSEGHLTLVFGPTSYPKIYNPFDILTTIARSIFVTCDHPTSSSLDRPDRSSIFASHLTFLDNDTEAYTTVAATRRKILEHVNDKIEIIPVFGDEPLRLFAMTSSFPGVVRYGACLKCCLQVCSAASLPYIVLQPFHSRK